MHCQQGLGTEGRLRNEEQEQCFDKAAVTGITARMSNHIPWRLRAGQLQVGRTRALTAFLSLDLKKKKKARGESAINCSAEHGTEQLLPGVRKKNSRCESP